MLWTFNKIKLIIISGGVVQCDIYSACAPVINTFGRGKEIFCTSLWLICDLLSCRPVTISCWSPNSPAHPVTQFCVHSVLAGFYYTGRFIMFSMITNIYNKKTKGPMLMELFTATGKLKKVFFWQLEVFDVCTMGDMAHTDMEVKFLPHTHQHGCIDILHCCNDLCL
jgi:hypothetical protein